MKDEDCYQNNSVLLDRIGMLEKEVSSLKEEIESSKQMDRVSIVIFSGEWDKLFAAFTIANGALALGMDVHLFFTFWGATALKDGKNKKKGSSNKMMDLFMPRSADDLPLSKMNLGGLGKSSMKKLLKEKKIDDLPELIESARDLGAIFHCCDTTMDLFGYTCDDIIKGDETNWCGVASFLSLSLRSKITLFI